MKLIRKRDRDEIIPDYVRARVLPTCPRCKRTPHFRVYADNAFAYKWFFAPTCCGMVAEGDGQTEMNEDWRQYAE